MELNATMERPSPLVPGYFLDRYELLCPIADGGMASVWVARLQGKHGFEKLFAVKTILPEHAGDARFQQMFLDEARIASRIVHTNVAQILDLGEQHEILYIVMEWVEGDSLARLYRTTKQKNVAIPQNVLLRIVADACGGLHAAHELAGPDGKSLNVVHRDVTPQNILVSNLGVARLIDFGIAKARDRLGDDTNAGMLKGKLHYMAPEQAMGGEVDRRTDVFALGAVLYRMLSHKPAFEAKSPTQLLQRFGTKQPPEPLPSTVHPAVAQLVMRALAPEPRDRFATAAELQTAIEGAMVQAKLQCTTADVARFVKDHMAAHAKERKEAIDVAIAAAKERHHETASGIMPAGSAPDEPISIELVEPSNTKRTIAVAVAFALLAAVAAVAVAIALHRPPPKVIVEQSAPATSTVVIVAAPPPTTSAAIPALPTVAVDDLPKPATAAPAPTTHAAPHTTHKHRNYGF